MDLYNRAKDKKFLDDYWSRYQKLFFESRDDKSILELILFAVYPLIAIFLKVFNIIDQNLTYLTLKKSPSTCNLINNN